MTTENIDLLTLDEKALAKEMARADIRIKRGQAALLEAQVRFEDARTTSLLQENELLG